MPMWRPDSWQDEPCKQRFMYPVEDSLETTTKQLSQLPPLVTLPEIQLLKQQLAEAANGKRFVLQGGDCAETFANCRVGDITNTLKILLQVSLVLVHGLRIPVTRIGRFAGQYAKPRSNETEIRDEVELPSYRGDLINGVHFDEASRVPDPKRLLKGYHYAALTMNYIRALVNDGFADLQHPENWNLNFVKQSPNAKKYHEITESLKNAIEVLSSIDVCLASNLKKVEFFTSHEALNLYYEQSLTRQAETGEWFNGSTHYPWIGMRTANIPGAHIEYARGICNPIAVKVGPDADHQWLRELINLLNPQNEPGRLTLVTRLGSENVKTLLPDLIAVGRETKKSVVWLCDPMHGNTKMTRDGRKTRSFDDIADELKQTFLIHKNHQSILSGVHFELTGENVTECIGGARGLSEKDLGKAYKSLVDPRLNYEQSLELALSIVDDFKQVH